jgi:hypothetical protein
MVESAIARKRAVWPVLVHSVRTAMAAVVSVLAARLFRLPETYWAPTTTLVITHSPPLDCRYQRLRFKCCTGSIKKVAESCDD